VLVTPPCVIPIEFKVGAKKFDRLDYEQAWDYGLDLKNFHAPSHAAPILPILCATEARESDLPAFGFDTTRFSLREWCRCRGGRSLPCTPQPCRPREPGRISCRHTSRSSVGQ
jgi:hypothetical protein